MRILLSISAALLIAGPGCLAQSFDEVRSFPDAYIWAEGWGRSVQEADTQALSSLCNAVSVSVTSSFRLTETDRRSTSGCNAESVAQGCIQIFSCATFDGSGMEVLSGGRRAHVARWIGRDEVTRILEERAAEKKRLDDISVRVISRDGETVSLAFISSGNYAAGTDFRFFDGRAWSPVCHCSDGRARIELSPGALGEHIQVMVESPSGMKVLKIAEKN